MRLPHLEKVVETHSPDIIGLQETKVVDEEFPIEAIESLGYQACFHGQKTHYGVALLSKIPFKTYNKGFPFDDENAQKRLIGATFNSPLGGNLTIINGYFPQGESRSHPVKFPAKKKFYTDLLQYIEENFQPSDQLIVMGDMNISFQDIDIGIGEDNRKRWLRTGKCSFLPEERQWLQNLQSWGLQDTYRTKYPQVNDQFSWFDYRSKGFEREPKRGLRIDLILASAPLISRCLNAGIDYDIRAMERPSDHCPIWSEFQ